MSSVSYKRNTRINHLVSVKMNRNTVLEIFGSFYLRNECESLIVPITFLITPKRAKSKN